MIRVFEGISLARQSLALAPNHPTTEYKFDHSVHLVHSVEKLSRKVLVIRESGPRRSQLRAWLHERIPRQLRQTR